MDRRAALSRRRGGARADGLTRLALTSTLTAQRFYGARGGVVDGDPVAGFGVARGQPMLKALAV